MNRLFDVIPAALVDGQRHDGSDYQYYVFHCLSLYACVIS